MAKGDLPGPESLSQRHLVDAYHEFAKEWHPDRVGCSTTVLFIGESPPPIDQAVVEEYLDRGDERQIPYFYNAQETWSCRRLAYAISTLFFRPDKNAWKFGDRKRVFLERFQMSGFLLKDLHEIPLGRGDSTKDFRGMESRQKRFQEITDSSPHDDIIVLLKKLDDWVPKKIKRDSEHYRAVKFPTRCGPQSLSDALSALRYHLDVETGFYKKDCEMSMNGTPPRGATTESRTAAPWRQSF